jgi:hypothetical protein
MSTIDATTYALKRRLTAPPAAFAALELVVFAGQSGSPSSLDDTVE